MWVSPLTNGRYAVSLFNRSPSADTITVTASMLDVPASMSFSVYDIWAGAQRGSFTGQYSAVVQSQAVVYIVLTPA